mgnify:CR=1 FL=1
MKFSEKLVMLRKRYSVSQTDLAEAVGVSRKSIQFYEAGERYPRGRVLEKLAEYFNVSLEYLTSTDEHYIPEKGTGTAAYLVNEVAMLFAGGTLSDEDKDLAMRVIQEAYWDSKGIKIPSEKK